MVFGNELLRKCKKVLKEQIKSVKFIDHLSSELTELLNVLKRTVRHRESDSVLIIGPHGCGKTALVNEAVLKLNKFCKNEEFIVIKLNGLIHIDDNLALKDIIRQLNFQCDDDSKFSGSFSDNLLHLLQTFKDGIGKISKALIFIIEEFNLFCSHRNQTLLYNLFDSAQSSQGVCIVGITSRLDITEMLEKRVKSRFSHRQILLLYQPTYEQRLLLFKNLLKLPTNSKYVDDLHYVSFWNNTIDALSSDLKVVQVLKRQLVLDISESNFRSFLISLLAQLSDDHCVLKPDDVIHVNKNLSQDNKVILLKGLSVLEICLVIAMSHQYEIFDGEPFNFEMIIGRYLKFANQNSAIQICQRPVILKAFERIKNLELILPVGTAGKNIQKEFQLYHFVLTKEQVTSAVNGYSGIPTDVSLWATSNLL